MNYLLVIPNNPVVAEKLCDLLSDSLSSDLDSRDAFVIDEKGEFAKEHNELVFDIDNDIYVLGNKTEEELKEFSTYYWDGDIMIEDLKRF